MPIYEYECLSCREEFEELVLGGDNGVQCPSCKGDHVKKLMSAAAFKRNGQFVNATSSGGCSSCTSHSCSSCK